jgi:hypothetical protein
MSIYCCLLDVDPEAVQTMCHVGIERKLNGEFNKRKGTCSTLIGGDYSDMRVETNFSSV